MGGRENVNNRTARDRENSRTIGREKIIDWRERRNKRPSSSDALISSL